MLDFYFPANSRTQCSDALTCEKSKTTHHIPGLSIWTVWSNIISDKPVKAANDLNMAAPVMIQKYCFSQSDIFRHRSVSLRACGFEKPFEQTQH